MDKIVVLFHTCDRYEYTKRTVKSFFEHNSHDYYDPWYCDDGSEPPIRQSIQKLMAAHGVRPIVQNPSRSGIGKTMHAAIHALDAKLNPRLLLYIQNDCETMRPIPYDLVQRVFALKYVGIFRMFGQYKGENRKWRAGKIHYGSPLREKVKWRPVGFSNLEVGRIHWCHMPTITLMECLRVWVVPPIPGDFNRRNSPERMAYRMQDGNHPKIKTVRPMHENFISHFGADKTPGRFID